MLEKISDHFIVCGFGRIGSIVAQEFRRQGIPHVIVNGQIAIDDGRATGALAGEAVP